MTILVYPSTLPGEPLEQHPHGRTTLDAWLRANVDGYAPRDEPPISIAVDGELVPPAEWAGTEVTSGQRVEIRPQPKDPGTAAIAAIVAAGVAVAATLLLAPSLPSQKNRGQKGSRILEVSAKGNSARLGDVIPELAGRHRRFPDYLSAPRRYYVDKNTQALDMLLCIGKGEFDLPPEEIRIGQTPIGRLGSAVDYAVFGPNELVSGHQAHENWYNAPEVGATSGASGIQLKSVPDQNYSGTASTDGNKLWMSVPSSWDVGMEMAIDLYRTVTIADGGTETVETEVVTGVTVQDGDSKTFIDNVTVERDSDGNITDVTTSAGETVSGAISSTATETISQETHLPDVLSGDWAGLTVGDRIRIKGNDDLDGAYVVATLSGSDMTLTRPGGDPVTRLPTGAMQIAVDREQATYRIDSIETNRSWMTFTRLLPDGSTDASWTQFPAHDGQARLTIVEGAGEWAGPFSACPESETTEFIEFDIVAPQGLGKVFSDGNIGHRQHDIELQYREVGTTTWTSVGRGFVGNSRDQLGFTRRIQLPRPMTPEVQMRRLGPEPSDTRELSRLEWRGLRSRLTPAVRYPGVTVLAMTITGSDTIAAQTENQVSVVATRKLPTRSGGAWTAPQATRDIVPWLAYIAKSVGYTDANLDLDEMDRLDAIWKGRGDRFDFIEADDSTVRESLNRVLRAGMAELTIDAGRLSPRRDEPRTTFEHMYTPQNMLEPLGRAVQAPRPDDPDGVDVEYVDAASWTEEVVECRLPGDAGIRPEKVRLEGVTDRTRAWRLGMRRRRELKYRRWEYSFSTELDALNSRYLSYCAVADDVPGYGQSSLLEAITAEGSQYRLTVSEPMEWQEDESHVVAWRRPDGTLAGPFPAAQGADEYEILATHGGEPAPSISVQQEPPHVLFGTTERWSYPVLVQDISPQGFESVSVSAVGYDARVYADDDNSPA